MADNSANLVVRICDGRRGLMPDASDIFVRILDGRFNFANAQWDQLLQTHKSYCDLFCAIAPDAEQRWSKLVAADSAEAALAADVLNILTALRDIHLKAGTPSDYLKAISWDAPFDFQPDGSARSVRQAVDIVAAGDGGGRLRAALHDRGGVNR
jgi:hypothetical protein